MWADENLYLRMSLSAQGGLLNCGSLLIFFQYFYGSVFPYFYGVIMATEADFVRKSSQLTQFCCDSLGGH